MSNRTKNSDNQEFKVPPAFKFQESEKVLCFHGPLIYEAKCNQARYDDLERTNKYHIHYSGWNKSWDEWVPETRVLKYNETNIQKQKDLHKAQKAEPKGKKGKKRSVTGKEKDGEGKEKEADDSRSSTPVNEKGGGKASASATQSSSQESASDIPKRKRSKLDPSVESSDDQTKLAEESKKPAWKVALAGPKRQKKSAKGISPSRSPKKQVSTSPKAKSPATKAKFKQNGPINKTTSKSPKSGNELKKGTKTPKRSDGSPTKYPGMNGKKLRISISALDVKNCNNEANDDSDTDSSFGAYVAAELSKVTDASKKAQLKTEIQKLLKPKP